jgi:Rps23 Pro-64 3,4-dihydroxylase Tpa1-like proline 4-hydroxylase
MQAIFEGARYRELAQKLREGYASADPFPHIVIDDFLPAEIAERVLAEFPKPETREWQTFDNPMEKKLASREERDFGDFTRELMHEFNAKGCLQFLTALTGIEHLIPDPHFEGGGLHQIQPGGFLKIHADFNFHSTYQLNRRINLLLYLNKDWQEDWNGHLELWDRSMSRCVKKVTPVFNRCVVFSTTDDAYHGHPEALKCPEGRSRKSLALYYYTNGRPEGEAFVKHTTLFRRRPEEVGGPVRRSVFSIRYRLARLFRKLAHMAEPDRKTIKGARVDAGAHTH